MNCPHCQKELPKEYSAMWCPFCGQDLSPQKPPQDAPPFKINWWVFFVALLLPPFLTLLTAMSNLSPNQSVSPFIALIGGLVGGIVCGVMLGYQGSRNLFVRIILSLVMSVVMVAVCIVLCFFGCTVGGYQFLM